MPPDSSFGTNDWAAALIKTINLALLDLENDGDNAGCEEFVEYICSEVQKALDWSVKFDDKLTMRTIATLPFLILNADETLIASKMMQQCRSYIFMTLFSRLPSSEIIIEELFNLSSSSHRDNTLMDFAEMILRSPSSSDALVAHIIGLYDDTQLIQINESMPLAKTIADKIVWQTSQSTTTAKALLKAVNATQTHFEDFLKLDDEMCCACLVESISANIEDYGVDSWLSQLTSSTVWEKMIDKAISKNLQSYECNRWQLVVNAVVRMTNREDVISRIVENEVAQSVEPFVDLMNTCSKTMIGDECRTKVATKALENIFESSNVSDEEIEKVVGAICSTVIAEDFIVDYIDRKLDEDNLRENWLVMPLYCCCHCHLCYCYYCYHCKLIS
ncbi:unnamed protein product [Anisakis simplex]|uniref:Uncharacterized protein n=1 Tax=Anisakis simplex TaxID=6269 RepID=A0A3P6NMF0_ANISI|nr:unnamed protein product [Anisakis simplex]